MQKRILIVSNRLPFRIEKKDGIYELKQSSGGLVSAIKSIASTNKIIWVGAADFKEEVWEAYKNAHPNASLHIHPVFLNKKKEKLYYNGFSNSLLWPLFHYFPSFAEYDTDAYNAYKEVNQLFAQTVRSIALDNDLIWIHDYHLMLLPGYLKNNPHPLSSSFFLHIPFPSYELIKLIPEDWRNEILKSLLCADVAGFHIPEYVHHFTESHTYFLGKTGRNNQIKSENHLTLIKDYPISIDFEQFNSAYNLPTVISEREGIQKNHPERKIIFSLDRLDYSKGVMKRLQAYEKLLASKTDLHEKVVFIINIIPSREEINKYAERKKIIEGNISRINGLYGNFQWQPILYQYQHLNFNTLLAYYTACDIALITPVRDGMNLVAKEFVASRYDTRGVLILSEFAGAAQTMKGALLVNPNDINAMQIAILKAIEMPPAEQSERLLSMQTHLRENNVSKWAEKCLTDMINMKQENIGLLPSIMSFDDKLKIMEGYRKSSRRLILLDYDGTLVRFYNNPADASPDESLKNLLTGLSDNPYNKVVIVSGRDAKTLNDWLGPLNIDIAAEHGMKYKKAKGTWQTTHKPPLLWKENVKDLIQRYTDQVNGSFIEEKEFTIAWHYRAAENSTAEHRITDLSDELMQLKENSTFEILKGNKVLEVKSNHGNKGLFIQSLMENETFDFVLAIGDDVTDEDMFSVLTDKNQFTVKVGMGHSSAQFNLLNVTSVISFLEQLSLVRNKLPNQ